VIDALAAIHDELWDDGVGLVRLPTTPFLHSVRESALGAFFDLERGNVDRATAALRAVLQNQYLDAGVAWSGTFRVCAEEHPPPLTGAQEWYHYDPNWRQFLGCILAFTLLRHGDALPDDVTAGMRAAITRCIDGEPAARIPEWYTNPNLMHAWLSADEMRLERIMARFARYGDVDEYNSPTYDGIDLFATALWVTRPPTPAFAAAGTTLTEHVGTRLSTLFHPELGAICGPYIRAYGLALDRYVSLTGIWLALAGAQHVLPGRLDANTDHVHDLFFAPVFAALADAVLPHLELRDVTERREHTQRFGDVEATSLLTPDAAIGAERGRRSTFSLDQYVPFTAHAEGYWVGAKGVALDAEITGPHTAHLRVAGELQLVASHEFTLHDEGFELGPIRVTVTRRTPSADR
jgi:hypothetical protein